MSNYSSFRRRSTLRIGRGERRAYVNIAIDKDLLLPIVALLQRDDGSTDCACLRHPRVGPLSRVVKRDAGTANAMQKTR